MAYSFPAPGSNGWNATYEAIIADLETRIVARARPVSLRVVSNDAPAWMKEGADATGTNGAWLCDGTADDVQINAALAAAATGAGGISRVQLSGGRFFCANSVLLQTGVTLEGAGALTALTAVNLTAATGYGTGVAVVKCAAVSTHVARVTNLYIDGNGASGGATASGIWCESTTASNDYSTYPPTDPDPDLKIDNLLIRGFANGTTRHGIVIGADMRGTIIESLQMRQFSGHGIWFTGAPDSHISLVHMGGAAGNGFYIQGGNVKLTNVKAYFCDDAAFRITSGRGSIVGAESQDSHIGFVFDGSPMVASGLVADTSETDGIIASAQQLQLHPFQVFTRGSGRYATCLRGLTVDAVYNDCNVQGNVDPSGVTTPVSGFANLSGGARNFARVSTGSALLTTG